MSDSNKAQAPSDGASDAPETPVEKSPTSASPEQAARGATESAETPNPTKRRRKRRRGGRNKKKAEPAGQTGTPASAPPLDPGLAALAGGLLSHIDDREVPCSSDGCNGTWMWSAAEQMTAYGQPPPRRECERCSGTAAMDVRCSVEGCKRTWTWSREAQIKHRAWSKRRAGERGGKKRRRKGDGPPRRKCELCQAKLAKLTERPSVCKVHGCTRPVMIDRDAQLRAWAASGSADLEFEAGLAKQMCDVCREFCRTHDDRAVPCGRPGCDKTWTYKRGAQLQAFLAGRFEDPIRLCEACESESRKAAHGAGTPANVELMPCIVPGCDGVWHFRAGSKVPPCHDGDQPVERMCDEHRRTHGADAREPSAAPPAPPARAAATPETDRENPPSVDPIS